MAVHFKISQHGNHDNDVVAMDTDNHNIALHWRHFLDRLVGIIKSNNSSLVCCIGFLMIDSRSQ